MGSRFGLKRDLCWLIDTSLWWKMESSGWEYAVEFPSRVNDVIGIVALRSEGVNPFLMFMDFLRVTLFPALVSMVLPTEYFLVCSFASRIGGTRL